MAKRKRYRRRLNPLKWWETGKYKIRDAIMEYSKQKARRKNREYERWLRDRLENLEEEDDNLSEDQKKELGETQKELYRIVEDRIRGEYIRARIVEVIERSGRTGMVPKSC